MRTFYFFVILLITTGFAPNLHAQKPAKDAVMQVVQTLFDGMRKGDSTMVRSAFHPKIKMGTTFLDRNGKPQAQIEDSPRNFLEAVGKPHPQIWDERIGVVDIRVDGSLATAWMPYTFYIGDKLSHCGHNSMQFVETESGWKILFLLDTRTRNNCDDPKNLLPTLEASLNTFIDAWHRAAATADENVFFGSMNADGVYLGTDETERWTRPEFEAWGMKYFQGETAWDFKPKNRHIMISQDGRMAWWDELLDTWMGVCRGSGVLVLTSNGWKIQHYNLAVTVPNDKINGFIELVTGKKQKRK
ncbi:MAG: nuclear transport factor 2 family protein [Bacteroidetes Order II. Incertae sedis bacterium]|nr:nuclear transport factor 2 family protein [Bacteroidetes Order II. bacterium]